METNRFSIVVDGQTVIGEIVVRQKHHIRVNIISPYKNWHNDRFISGQGRMFPIHFLTNRGDEVAKELLIDSYRKLEIIDEDIERHCRVFEMLEEEISEVNKLSDSEVKKRIISKLNDWFFYCLFTPRVTGLCASVFESERIIDIINAYRRSKRKIYRE